MIDFWEAIGRLATYTDLNENFMKVVPAAHAIPRVTVYDKTLKSSSVGLDIPQAQYEAVQSFFAPILAENYLSLMAAGELVMTYSHEESVVAMRQILESTSKATPEPYGPSTRYFITLGILIVDELFRRDLRGNGTDAVKRLRRLADPESDRITNLANDPKFESAAAAFSRIWDAGCDARLLFWPGHLHPVGLDSDTWQSGNGTSSATAYLKSAAGTS